MPPSQIEPVVAPVMVAEGVLGPGPVSFEVRCFVVASRDGVVQVDTATPGVPLTATC